MDKCPFYRGVRLTFVRLVEVFLLERHLRSAGTCKSVSLREVSVLWDIRLKRFDCIMILLPCLVELCELKYLNAFVTLHIP